MKMVPTKVYFSIIMLIFHETVAHNYDSVICIETLAVIFNLREPPEKTAQMCYERIFYELTKESIKNEHWDFSQSAQDLSQNLPQDILESLIEAMGFDFTNNEIDLSQEAINSLPDVEEYYKVEYGLLYMNYIYSKVTRGRINVAIPYCERFQGYFNECLTSLQDSGLDYRQSMHALKTLFESETRTRFGEGTFPYMYYDHVYQNTTLDEKTMTPYRWCSEQMYSYSKRPRFDNYNKPQLKNKKIKNKSSGQWSDDASHSSVNVQD